MILFLVNCSIIFDCRSQPIIKEHEYKPTIRFQFGTVRCSFGRLENSIRPNEIQIVEIRMLWSGTGPFPAKPGDAFEITEGLSVVGHGEVIKSRIAHCH